MSATPDSTFTNREQLIADLERQLAEFRAERDEAQRQLAETTSERDEALAQQTATAEILGVINSSPGHLTPVFEAITEKAMRLCEAAHGALFTYDGDLFHVAAMHSDPRLVGWHQQLGPFRPPADTGAGRISRGERLVHTADVRELDAFRTSPEFRQAAETGGFRSVLNVALRRDEALLGVLTVYRREVRPFTDKQIALLQNFAAQAVIAMENARLLTETREALEQQTATAAVLGVINSSPGDLAPVFDAILEKAHAFCGATYGTLLLRDGETFRALTTRGYPKSLADQLRQGGQPGPSHPIWRLVEGESFTHVPDLAIVEELWAQSVVQLAGVRTSLWVPLRRDGNLLGAITAARADVRPFTDKQIALLENFAAQAVIAMENARLLTETREALEQQTATAEVLGVINSSPGDLAPVFDAMLEKAMRLCEASHAHLFTLDGEQVYPAAVRGDPNFCEWARQQGSMPIALGSSVDRMRRGEPFVHVLDAREMPPYHGNPFFRELIDRSGCRTAINVPLRKDSGLLGTIHLYRPEVRAFTDKQIALLQNFAAQAVIAMENARLITETREALAQQTATAEVLQVINSSPGDLAPVFDAMLEKATRLCDAGFGILWTYDGDSFRASALRNVPAVYAEFLARAPYRPDPRSAHGRIVTGERLIQFVDVADTELYRSGDPLRQALVDLGGARSGLAVSLRKEEALLGVFVIYRQEVRPFTEKQIILVENFAAQAVIAMENARLLTETREALEQQTATAEVLQVINSSPGDLTPVFDAIVEKAHTLCAAASGSLQLWDGQKFRGVAIRGFPEAMVELLRAGYSPSGLPCQRIVEGERVVHCADLAEITREGGVKLGGVRTILYVALRKDDVLLGQIVAVRQEVRPFSEKEIALVENFAAQAVIAMENARLLTETREALEQQTATAEVLQVINSSPGDLTPVFGAMLEKAMGLCEAAFGMLQRFDGERFEVTALRGVPSAYAEFLFSDPPHSGPGTAPARILAGEQIVHLHDLKAEDAYTNGDPRRRALVDLGGARTSTAAALRKEGRLLGTFTVYRQEVRPFTDKQIALLQNFAAQAVIAMENARLLTETREALEQQTATAEILGVINRSPGDLAPVFDAVLEKAHSLCDIAQGSLELYDGENFRSVAERGLPEAFAEMLRQGYPASANPASRPLIEGSRFTHIADLTQTDYAITQSGADLASVRTLLCIPLRRENVLLGMIACARQEVRLFSEKEIALLESFAAQAVIAMDNARLLNEIRQRQAELRVTFDNMGDGVAMFDSELRLAAWNLNFQQILELPDPLLAERPSYPDYIRFLAERGEFGAEGIAPELSRRLEATDQELRLERTRPDGRVIEVRRNAVPGGGFVVIYSDVTERKRAEAEIRAARDTAERALQELQTAQSSLVHAQKMAALGQLTAGIAHEIKNPLNFVNNFAELSGELLRELKETTAPAVAALGDDERAAVDEVVEMLRGNLDKIAEHGKRADGIVKSMLEHSRGVSGERRVVDLNALIEEALNLAYHGARAQDASFNITLEREFDDSRAWIELAPQEMTRVFLNLLGNGFYATTKRQRDGSGPDFRPTLKVATRDLGDAIEVRVRDNGTGIAPEVRDKLFQPFVTTKPTGEGTGLGLSIAYDIVSQQHGGTIEVDSQVGEFTEFTIRLPRTRLTTAEAAS